MLSDSGPHLTNQGSGGDQCNVLCLQLQALGFSVWYDNGQMADARNLPGMKLGVRQSMCLLLFLSGRCETNGQPDPHGVYEGQSGWNSTCIAHTSDVWSHSSTEGACHSSTKALCVFISLSLSLSLSLCVCVCGCEGPFTRWFCHEEMAAAHDAGLSFVGVMETEDRPGKPYFVAEKSRALLGGIDGTS